MKKPKKRELINGYDLVDVIEDASAKGYNEAIEDYEKYLDSISVEKIEDIIKHTKIEGYAFHDPIVMLHVDNVRELAEAIKALIEGEES